MRHKKYTALAMTEAEKMSRISYAKSDLGLDEWA
jgi:hypothetical protein